MRRRAYLTRLFTLVANIATVLRLLITVYAVDIGAHPTLFFCETVHIRAYFAVFIQLFYAVASPGFVARRGKDGNYVMGQSRWTSGPGAAAAR